MIAIYQNTLYDKQYLKIYPSGDFGWSTTERTLLSPVEAVTMKLALHGAYPDSNFWSEVVQDDE